MCIKNVDEEISKLGEHFTRLFPLEKYEHKYRNECPKFTNIDSNKEIDTTTHPTYRDNGFVEECSIKLNLKITKK